MKKKITIKEIFEDNFKQFWERNKIRHPEKSRAHIFIQVMKTLANNADILLMLIFLILNTKIRYLYDKYRHYYFSPLRFFKVTSSSYLNVTFLKTESIFS
jgi:hypothetical protein